MNQPGCHGLFHDSGLFECCHSGFVLVHNATAVIATWLVIRLGIVFMTSLCFGLGMSGGPTLLCIYIYTYIIYIYTHISYIYMRLYLFIRNVCTSG